MGRITKQIKTGWAAYHKSDFKSAIEFYEKDIVENGERLHILGPLAYCYKEEGDLEKSINYCDKALKIDPTYYYAFEILAEVYAKKNETAKAYHCIQMALKNRPPTPKLPDAVNKIGRAIIKIFGLKNTNELKAIWNEPDDIGWLNWARKYKMTYEINKEDT